MKSKFRNQENMPKWPKSEIYKNGICPQSGTLTVDHVLWIGMGGNKGFPGCNFTEKSKGPEPPKITHFIKFLASANCCAQFSF